MSDEKAWQYTQKTTMEPMMRTLIKQTIFWLVCWRLIPRRLAGHALRRLADA